MIPARLTCPDGWTKEYVGYLMSAHYTHQGRTTYTCVDNARKLSMAVGRTKTAFFSTTSRLCVAHCRVPNM
ncbi:hypothetical protein NP493_816g02017 [Ridgeia piscesae]|uniref:Uncharacterized protein n=1 Tax=Ridgeia piscesae TaxID=27915 RepID=A0AAD9KPG6_RIDPI|nr:hypothetical protein NP493_816g02017 [Ridgeia piscesae]